MRRSQLSPVRTHRCYDFGYESGSSHAVANKAAIHALSNAYLHRNLFYWWFNQQSLLVKNYDVENSATVQSRLVTMLTEKDDNILFLPNPIRKIYNAKLGLYYAKNTFHIFASALFLGVKKGFVNIFLVHNEEKKKLWMIPSHKHYG